MAAGAVLSSLILGIPLALAVAAICYGPVIALHGRRFIDEFFVQHHFARYVSNKYHHPQPLYFYPAIILMLALPWTVHLIAALAKVRSWNWCDDDSLTLARVFSLAWLLFPIIFSLNSFLTPNKIVMGHPCLVALLSPCRF